MSSLEDGRQFPATYVENGYDRLTEGDNYE